jgi:hypothetical protein
VPLDEDEGQESDDAHDQGGTHRLIAKARS